MKRRPKAKRKDSPRVSHARDIASDQVNRDAKRRGVPDPDGGERSPGWLKWRLAQVKREQRRAK